MIDSDRLVYIGRISGTFGIKGTVKVIPLTDFPERFLKTEYVYLVDERRKQLIKDKFSGSHEFHICNSEISKGFVKIDFVNYESISDSELLKGMLLGVDEKDRVKLPEGLFYFYDLTGCEVFDRGKTAGFVTGVENYGSSDLLVVESGGKSFYVPLLKEFVKKIDVDAKRIDTELIEGFKDED